MRTFILLAAVACVAIILLEISGSDARGGRRCRQKPPMNTSSDVCDEEQKSRKARECRKTCRDCYERDELNRKPPGCLVNKQCVCLSGNGEKSSSSEEVTTAEPTTQAPTTQAPTTNAPTTNAPTTVA